MMLPFVEADIINLLMAASSTIVFVSVTDNILFNFWKSVIPNQVSLNVFNFACSTLKS